jgi:hypothetical protein
MGELMDRMRRKGTTWLRRTFRRGSALASRLVVLAVAIVLVAGTVLAGSRYFYCPGMGVSQFSPCCAEQKGETSEQKAPLVERSCCESKFMRGLPVAQVDARPLVVAAPLVAVLSPLPAHDLPFVQPAKAVRARWGSDPPTPSRARSQLMVFLT